jgi:hypothetical protein
MLLCDGFSTQLSTQLLPARATHLHMALHVLRHSGVLASMLTEELPIVLGQVAASGIISSKGSVNISTIKGLGSITPIPHAVRVAGRNSKLASLPVHACIFSRAVWAVGLCCSCSCQCLRQAGVAATTVSIAGPS